MSKMSFVDRINDLFLKFSTFLEHCRGAFKNKENSKIIGNFGKTFLANIGEKCFKSLLENC